ncbi:hypothetical protein QJS10_CPB19g00073 [Acorus calamus]|uniref:Protein phosphatase 1 regulatory subunit 11 n=1 Tax=Acorus calamus TaxID=4465 RepID=A0AAV9CKS3_ACOCL|nr:hypothetical protein QJS10_CPB19g00073 [Acorus calamus]
MARSSTMTTIETLILTEPVPPPPPPPPPPLTLTLRLELPSKKKKKVTWKEGTVDNEFLNRRSSKKCCVFHKQRPFDEDDSDDESDGYDRPSDGAGTGGCRDHSH